MEIMWAFHHVYAVTLTDKHPWWSETELQVLTAHMKSCVTLCQRLQNILLSPVPQSHRRCVGSLNKDGGNLPGNGLMIQKLHEWMAIVQHLRRYGSLSNSTTKPFEHGNVDAKKVEKGVRARERGQTKSSEILERLASNESQSGLTETQRKDHPGACSTSMRSRRAVAIKKNESRSDESFFNGVMAALESTPSVCPHNIDAHELRECVVRAASAFTSGELFTFSMGARVYGKNCSQSRGADITPGHFVELSHEGSPTKTLVQLWGEY
jgi:hypothetical protein